MIEIIKIESKRILSKEKFLLFLAIVFLFSVCSTYISLRGYMVPDIDGIAITWQENLAHAKKNLQGKNIDRELIESVRQRENFIYVDENSLEEIVRLNYEGESIRKLTDAEVDYVIEKYSQIVKEYVRSL